MTPKFRSRPYTTMSQDEINDLYDSAKDWKNRVHTGRSESEKQAYLSAIDDILYALNVEAEIADRIEDYISDEILYKRGV